jgi:hypothetical protein
MDKKNENAPLPDRMNVEGAEPRVLKEQENVESDDE